LITTPVLADDAKSEPKKAETEQQKMSYAFGYNVGERIKHDGVDIDISVFSQAMQDAMQGKTSRYTPEETQAIFTAFQAKRQDEMLKLAEKHKQEGQEFLDANKKKKGVVTLPSGLQYKIIKSGKGEKPTASDSVVAHYRGTLINGKEFDSSIARGEPATFPVSGVIPGWQEVLKLMPVGSKWQVFVPSNLAYAERGAGGDIGPNETLIFEIELLKIAKSDQPKTDEPKSDPHAAK
jgi:FKBP-type peptidyl-prolyl cis-trans isomerase